MISIQKFLSCMTCQVFSEASHQRPGASQSVDPLPTRQLNATFHDLPKFIIERSLWGEKFTILVADLLCVHSPMPPEYKLIISELVQSLFDENFVSFNITVCIFSNNPSGSQLLICCLQTVKWLMLARRWKLQYK